MMMMDIKNYYLGTPLPRFEYMKMLVSRFPEEIIQKYNLNDLAVDGWVYIEIEASRAPCEPVTSNSYVPIWILPSTAHPRPVVTQSSTYLFHSRFRRFRS
jgi:hypothetical protein